MENICQRYKIMTEDEWIQQYLDKEARKRPEILNLPYGELVEIARRNMPKPLKYSVHRRPIKGRLDPARARVSKKKASRPENISPKNS